MAGERLLEEAVVNALAVGRVADDRMRDVLQVVQFCLTVGIFASPVMFPASMFPASLRWVLWLNPMTAFIEAYQSILLRGALPPIDCWLAMGGWLLVIALVLDRALLYSREQLVDWL